MNVHANRIHAPSKSDRPISVRRGRLAPLLSWSVLRRHAAALIGRWRTGEIEEAIQGNGSVVTDSLERDIAARVGRSRGL
jgi:hypothetical protein